MTSYFAATAMVDQEWASDVRLDVADDGRIGKIAVGADSRGAVRLAGPVLPAMANCHCHAFQRAMAGLAEHKTSGRDSFWTWRETMYRFALQLSPDQIGAIAAQAYVEMLKSGFTTVAEFHYLHNDPKGLAYDDPAELSHRVVDAAGRAGIAITQLPVLYQTGGFAGAPPEPRQQRFIKTPGQLLDIVARLRKAYRDEPLVRIGLAPHSPRAVFEDGLDTVISEAKRHDSKMPIHIHIAEQQREVDDCLAWSKKRPLQWLLDSAPVDESWCLVHATHIDDGEIRALAATGAVVGLCPSTEANLGDGLFPLAPYLKAGGRIAVGSDSNVSVNMIEELRWLEYGQRLAGGTRLIAASDDRPSAGGALYRAALSGGARAAAQPVGALEAGARADFIVLDPDHPAIATKSGDRILDGLLFASSSNPIRDVYVGGARVIEAGRHGQEETIRAEFTDVLRSMEL